MVEPLLLSQLIFFSSEPNSTLPNSRNCPIACPNCCYNNKHACGADAQKYCDECCPSPAKEQSKDLPINFFSFNWNKNNHQPFFI